MSKLLTISTIQDLPIGDIVPSLLYRDLDHAVLEELKGSIAEKGLLQPIRVRSLSTSTWKVSFGDHRLQACKELGWKTIPAMVGGGDAASESILGVVENLHRNEKINLALMGDAFNRLMKEDHWTLERCAKEINKTTAYVERCLDIAEKVTLDLHRPFGDLIPRSLAQEFSRVPSENQGRVLDVIKKRGSKTSLSADSVRSLIRYHGHVQVSTRGEVYVCDNCGGLITHKDLDAGKADLGRRGTDFIRTHKNPGLRVQRHPRRSLLRSHTQRDCARNSSIR